LINNEEGYLMNRKLISILGILLVICMTANVALAETWVCPNCGAVNSGNFCSNCGTAKPVTSGSDTISNITFSAQSNGDTLVQWSDSSSASSYTVDYTTEDWDVTYTTSSISGQRTIMKYLIPGLTYQITVSNGSSETTQNYTVPRPIFTEYVTGDKYLDLTVESFSLSELKKKPTMTFEVRVSWPQLKYSRDYTAKLVLDTPYGYTSKVYHYDTFTFENRYSYTYMIFSLMSDWLDEVEDDYGSIPTGDYTFEIYMDGQLYDYASFTLSN